jgi:hypothetical protein
MVRRGTSFFSPLWSAIISDRDASQGGRAGNINQIVYGRLRSGSQASLHDIIDTVQLTDTNGIYPVPTDTT